MEIQAQGAYTAYIAFSSPSALFQESVHDIFLLLEPIYAGSMSRKKPIHASTKAPGTKISGSFDYQKNLSRTAREIEVGGVNGDFAEIFPEKNLNLADFTTGIRRIQVKSGGGGRGGGDTPPSTSLSKSLFDKLSSRNKDFRELSSVLNKEQTRRESTPGFVLS